jgi:hypothetical protein
MRAARCVRCTVKGPLLYECVLRVPVSSTAYHQERDLLNTPFRQLSIPNTRRMLVMHQISVFDRACNSLATIVANKEAPANRDTNIFGQERALPVESVVTGPIKHYNQCSKVSQVVMTWTCHHCGTPAIPAQLRKCNKCGHCRCAHCQVKRNLR